MLTIDYSNCSEGYVMVKAKPTAKTLKLRVVHNNMDIHYDLNSDGKYEVFPLQDGNGKYVFTLYEKGKSNSYKQLNTINITVDMPDPNRCFLYPNQYINYTPETPAVIFAQELCKGMTDPEDIALTIYNYIAWDESQFETWIDETGQQQTMLVERIEFSKLGIRDSLPEIDKTFATNKGVCKDVSGLMVAMLRSVGIPTKYIVGKAHNEEHAWIAIIINNSEIEIDPQDRIWDPKLKLNDLRIHEDRGREGSGRKLLRGRKGCNPRIFQHQPPVRSDHVYRPAVQAVREPGQGRRQVLHLFLYSGISASADEKRTRGGAGADIRLSVRRIKTL